MWHASFRAQLTLLNLMTSSPIRMVVDDRVSSLFMAVSSPSSALHQWLDTLLSFMSWMLWRVLPYTWEYICFFDRWIWFLIDTPWLLNFVVRFWVLWGTSMLFFHSVKEFLFLQCLPTLLMFWLSGKSQLLEWGGVSLWVWFALSWC